MKLKTLLLLPLLLTGCSQGNTSSEQIPLTELPVLPSESSTISTSRTENSSANSGSISSSDNSSSSSTPNEKPLSDLPTAESLDNLRKAEPKKAEEKIYDFAWEYLGRNVRLDADLASPDFFDEEHNPFVPEVFENMNEYVDTSFSGTKGKCVIRGQSFGNLCSQFTDRFVYSTYGSIYTTEQEKAFLELRNAKIEKYVGKYYSKTRFDNKCEGEETYTIITDLYSVTYKSRNDIRCFYNFYKQSYIDELASVLEKNELSTYYDFFEKYGTECINAVTFGPKRTMYLGFTGNVSFDIRENNQNGIKESVEELVKNNGNITLNDYWINESEYPIDDESNQGLRLISYRTVPFYNRLPEGLESYRNQIEEAYKQYQQLKIEEIKNDVNNQVEEQNHVNDAYYKSSNGEAISKKKPFSFQFNFVLESELYNPQSMLVAGFKNLYMRPRIIMSEDTNYDAEIIIGGKRAKVRDCNWYQININDLFNIDSNVHFKLTPESKVTAEIILEFCYMK